MFRNKLFIHVLIAMALLCSTNAVLAQNGPNIIYVKWDATGANNGTSWADAYISLQDALLAASADTEIWVAAGAYRPFMTTPENPSDTFQLKNGVALYGGFAGSETVREQRNWQTNVTILDGMQSGSPSVHVYNVVTGSGTDSTAVLDGFTVTGGNANGMFEPSDAGGGMFNQNGSPMLANLIFSGNYGSNGGGMANFYNSSPTLTNVIFSDNSAFNGGGMFNNHNSNPTVRNTTFSSNTAYYGGGMYNSDDGNPTLMSVTFRNNSVGYSGGGIYNGGSSPTLARVNFSGNSAGYSGGGMYNINSNPMLTNVIFSGNSVPGYGDNIGDGIYNMLSSPTLVNVTFSGNYSMIGGGMAVANVYSSYPTIANSILWASIAGYTAQIYVDEYSSPTVTYSDIQGGYPGTGNISVDPQFVRPPSPGVDGTWGTPDDDYGDLHLQSTSPAINAGNNAVVPPDITMDLDGNPRIMGGVVDMGAYEYELLEITVQIDIMPKNRYNPIDLRSTARVSVAVLSTAGFDATKRIDRATQTFGHTGSEQSLYKAPPTYKLACGVTDVNGDGLKDLVCDFQISKLGFQCGDTQGIYRARLLDGTPIIGSDAVVIRPCP